MKTNIVIKNLKIKCILGVGNEERKSPQEIIITIQLSINSKRASITDRIEDTVNYREIYNNIIADVEKSKFHLLESLGEYICNLCLQFQTVQAVKVSITKPNIFEKADGVTLDMEKNKQNE